MNAQEVLHLKQLQDMKEAEVSRERKIFMYSDLFNNMFGLRLDDYLNEQGKLDLKKFLFHIHISSSPLTIVSFLRINFGPEAVRIVKLLL